MNTISNIPIRLRIWFSQLPWRCVTSSTIWLLAISICIFIAEEYTVMGMWDAVRYQNLKGCSEKFYNFADSSPMSILIDKDLRNKCKQLDASYNESSVLRFDDNSSPKPPFIKTKCSIQNAELISFKKILPADNLDGKVVPNIVHYISIGKWEFSFLNYLSFLSVHRTQQPNYIFIHGDSFPHGTWWDKTLADVANIYHVTRVVPERMAGVKVRWLEHSTDVIRIQTLLDNGGIYLDTDILLLKSFTRFRRYNVTLGRETSYGLGSGIIVSKPQAAFLCVWFHVFKDYAPVPWKWAHYAVHTPHKLSQVMPADIHVEVGTLHQPSFENVELLFDKRIDWSPIYAAHIWKRRGHVPSSPVGIDQLNTTLGEMMRFVYYGTSELRQQ